MPQRTGTSPPKTLLRHLLPRTLSTQLTILFMGTFLLVLAISLLVLYADMADVLRRTYERDSIQRFKQVDYDISSFCSGRDLVSRQLVIDAELQSLNSYASLSQEERVSKVTLAVRAFNGILSNYRDINSILYYTSEGLIIKSSADENVVLFDSRTASDWFYRSAPYREALKNKQKIYWFGGYTSGDFGIVRHSGMGSGTRPTYYISAARNVLSGTATGTLVINIDMVTFTSVYNNQAAGDGGRMYIVDDSGDVIAANDAGMAGSKSPSLPILHAERASESFLFTSGGVRMRAFSYRLSTPLGLLVNEIPEGLTTRNIMTLRFIVLLMFCVSLLLAFGLSRFWLFRLMRPFRELMMAIRSVGQGNLGVTITDLPGNELGTLMRQFNMMSSNIKDLFNQKVTAEAEKRDLEMETLRSQINPHFIYNTLNNIKWMAMIDQKKTIADCLTTFTSFLEVVLREHEPTCTLREELNHLKNYIKIMNFRFGGGLELASDISEEFLDCRVVRFMLQPIVENSVVHGLEQRLNGVIRITVDRLGDDVTISVVDNGKGIERLPLKHLNQMLQEGSPASEAGIGLANVSRRLRLHFGPHSSIRVSSEERDGTVVTLTMPFVR